MRDWGVCKDCALKENCAEYKPYKRQCEDYERYKEVLTNEEWFIHLPTKEKAKWLYDHYVNARADEYYGRQEKTLYDYQKWLVDAHKGIDGTRVG